MLTINRVITLPTVSYGYSGLYCRSGARSVASRKSGGAERIGEREFQKNDGAERSAEQETRSGNEAGSGGYRNRLDAERVFRRSHDLDACYSVVCLRCRVCDVWHVGCIVRLVFVAYLCVNRVRAINRLDNARCALFRFSYMYV